MKKTITTTINGRSAEHDVEPRHLLSDFLRDDLGLTGTHVGCEHGVCGACTIMVNGEAARSCLMLAVQADGADIETIEGLSERGVIKDLQGLFAEHHGLQCGFCTPAMLIIAHDLLSRGGELSEVDVREGMSAAICRCTGYQGIVRAVMSAAEAKTSTAKSVGRAS